MNEKKVIPITFPAKLLEALRITAAHKECSIASLVRRASFDYLYNKHHDFLLGFLGISLLQELDLDL